MLALKKRDEAVNEVKITLGTSEEDPKNTLETSVKHRLRNQ
jgi:hypothetical protein